jgi:hypothetical protein
LAVAAGASLLNTVTRSSPVLLSRDDCGAKEGAIERALDFDSVADASTPCPLLDGRPDPPVAKRGATGLAGRAEPGCAGEVASCDEAVPLRSAESDLVTAKLGAAPGFFGSCGRVMTVEPPACSTRSARTVASVGSGVARTVALRISLRENFATCWLSMPSLMIVLLFPTM